MDRIREATRLIFRPYSTKAAAVGLSMSIVLSCTGTPDMAVMHTVVPDTLVSDRFRGAEGIAFTGEDRLFVTADRRLWEVSPDGSVRSVATLESTVGLAPIGDRDVLVAEFGGEVLPTAGTNQDGVILRITPEGRVDTVGAGMGDPNFIWVRRDGSLLVSDDFSGEIWEVKAGGNVRLFTRAIEHPNGMVESPDGRFLYVAQIFRRINPFEQDDRLWRIPLESGAPAGDPELVFRTGGIGGLDGLAIDAAGRVYIAANREGTLWRYDPRDGTAVVLAEGIEGLASIAFGRGSFGESTLYGVQLRGGDVWRFDLTSRGFVLHR